MRILFTGGSSFTGFWFIRELAQQGHDVVATFRKRPEEYRDEPRGTRVSLALQSCRGVFGCSFGDSRFLELVRSQPWDLLCHHAADVTNYKSPDFDVAAALANNIRNATAVLELLGSGEDGRRRLIVTGSVFENGEGAGSQGLPAFSPYGLSKSFTYEVFRHQAARAGFSLGKFVIPNPFGPYEEPRFTAYLMKTWFAGAKADVNAPEYVRDNIHVSLLAKAYADFAKTLPDHPCAQVRRPSGYIESQGMFACRFATEMRRRLGLPCEVNLRVQTEFQEPRVRINTDPVDGSNVGWEEDAAWSSIGNYYSAIFKAEKSNPTSRP